MLDNKWICFVCSIEHLFSSIFFTFSSTCIDWFKQQKSFFRLKIVGILNIYNIETFGWQFVGFYLLDYDSCALLLDGLSYFSQDHLSQIFNQMAFRLSSAVLNKLNSSFLMKFHFQAFTGYWLHNSITCNRIMVGLCKSHAKRSRCAIITTASFADVIGPRGDYISTWKSTGLGLDASLWVRL